MHTVPQKVVSLQYLSITRIAVCTFPSSQIFVRSLALLRTISKSLALQDFEAQKRCRARSDLWSFSIWNGFAHLFGQRHRFEAFCPTHYYRCEISLVLNFISPFVSNIVTTEAESVRVIARLCRNTLAIVKVNETKHHRIKRLRVAKGAACFITRSPFIALTQTNVGMRKDPNSRT